LQLRPTAIANPPSPQLIEGKPNDPQFNSIEFAKEHYNRHAKNAAESLMKFLNGLFPGDKPLCVTYFDEAHELGDALWMLLRLLQVQEASVKMWYVFMGTKSSVSYYAPRPENRKSYSTSPCPCSLYSKNCL
jgi:hypothetical protein